ncbi:thiol-disulfide oxidoreductase DCC family protein [Pleionea sp. CnH1-48]|uniref:thiol-disulfide oxidoreductase DCC family protein n=1 Tax=Pleionea sp. CnH1-48 TaxID=2954494 RepID=UPI0020969A38|nr:DCC1-like thiol-disulfide oxidoreductase family protein [Pleionea sp. CnH1-48]MCO7224222.1 DCC1-like thiol-disulfide oxidoreductase family protein [Pleionea sp. CnH1-48]
MAEQPKVILFDGVCVLCSRWTQFILRYDKRAIFQLCAVQSNHGQQLLAKFDLPQEDVRSMVYIDGEKYYLKSDAFLNVVCQLAAPWRWLNVFSKLPKSWRNSAYDFVAARRYDWFGRYDQCLIPDEKERHRFLS